MIEPRNNLITPPPPRNDLSLTHIVLALPPLPVLPRKRPDQRKHRKGEANV